MMAIVWLIVQFCNAGVQRSGIRRGESVRAEVQAIAESRAIRGWIEAEVVQYVRINARTPGARADAAAVRIHGRDLGGRKCDYASIAEIFDIPRLERRSRCGARDLAVLRGALPFIVAEEEELVFLDRAADRGAEGIADELAGNIRLTGRYLGCLVEPVVGHGHCIAVVLINAAVDPIRAPAGDNCDLRAGGITG